MMEWMYERCHRPNASEHRSLEGLAPPIRGGRRPVTAAAAHGCPVHPQSLSADTSGSAAFESVAFGKARIYIHK